MGERPWPFVGSEALRANGISERAMRAWYRAVYPDVYIPRGAELNAAQRAHAAWLWSRRQAVIGGNSAAAVLGAKWVDPTRPAELVHTNRRPPPLVTVHSDTLLTGEVTERGGLPVTTPARTAFDIGRRMPALPAVQRLDALAHATDFKVVEVEAVIARHPGARGLVGLREVLPLVDGRAESPQESRTRLALLEAGFPPPRTQIPVFDEFGFFVARLDMGWEEFLVGVEFDGAQHWTDPTQRTRDIDRSAGLDACRWTIIHANSDLLRYRLGTLIARVGAALRAAGWTPT